MGRLWHHLREPSSSSRLADVQSRLLEAGSAIATPLDASETSQLERATFDPKHVPKLEKYIDLLDSQAPTLKVFILPVSSPKALFLQAIPFSALN